MVHQQWLQLVQNALGEIKSQYPHSPKAEYPKWRNRFQKIKKSCDQMLETWALIEEQLCELLKLYPELGSTHKTEEIEEEVWLHESSVRQFRQGQGYYGLSMFREAKSLFQSIMEREPDFLLGRIYLGLTYFEEKEWDEARKQFQLVCSTTSQDIFLGFAHQLLGCIAVCEGDDRLAIRHFSKVVSLLPDQPDGWFNLGACHVRLEEWHEAIPYFFHALSLNEDDWESMVYLSRCYRACEEWQSVHFWRLASYEKCNHPKVIECIAHDYEEMGEVDQAIQWYKRLLTLHQKHAGAYRGLAWNYWVKDERDLAFAWIKKGLSLHPHHHGLLFTYAWMMMGSGMMEEAEKVIQLLPSNVREEPVWLALQSRLSTKKGHYTLATQIAERLMQHELKPLQALGHFHKGRALMEMGKIKEAMDHFLHAHKQMRHWKDPLFFQGICHLIEGRVDQMQDCFKELIPYPGG